MKKFTRAFVLLTAICCLCLPAQAAVFINKTQVNVSCKGGNNGSIDITPSGGSAPYTYNWGGAITTQDRSNLTAGTYSITVSDFFGVSASLSITITEPTFITTTKSITSVFCGGGNTGAIQLTASGGTPGYTYIWNDLSTTPNRSNLTAANYYVTITDSKGCTKIDSANVTQPPGMVLSKTTTNVTCGSGANGAINLTVQFGVPGYSYLWNGGATTEDRTGIAAGSYVVTVTDASGCSASLSATVGQSGSTMGINSNSVMPSCYGGSNGTITVTSVVGSVGPYTYAWSDGPTTQSRTGLAAGSYTVTATSSTGCTTSNIINVAQPPLLSVVLVPFSLSCNASNNGAINTTASGGTGSYSYVWNDGSHLRNRTGLPAGNYIITVTDAKGCTVVDTAVVPEPLMLVLTQTPTPLACIGGPTGSVTANATGGTEPYNYWWGGGVITQTISNVGAGTYCATVTDNHGCTASACANIPVFIPLSVTTTQTNVICYGANTGSINVTPSNGTSPYTYLWSNGSLSQNRTALPAGTYTVTISDANPCTVSQTITITQPLFPLQINSTIADAMCYGNSNGSINITVINGTSPYSYNWGNGITTQNRTALVTGTYPLTVTDINSCSVSSSFFVSQPTLLVVSPTVANVSCFGGSNGSITLGVTGSFAPYTYSWNNGSGSPIRNGLLAGNYFVTVTDNHTCTATSSAVVNQPTAVAIVVSHGDAPCFGTSNGWINLVVSEGVAPYSYNWGNGIFTQNRTSLSAGSYPVTVTDNAGCTATASATISQPTAITVSSSVINATCFGGNNGSINLSVSGGTSPYTYNWAGNITTPIRTNLGGGTYAVTVTDAQSCTATHSAFVGPASGLSITPIVTNVSCNAGTNGSISLSVSGATPPYTFSWANGGGTLPNRTGLSANSYTVTVTDNLGCTASNTSTVIQPSVISVTTNVTNANCFGGNNGAIVVGVSGGTSPYSFNWSSGAFSQNLNLLSAGNYTVTITDNANCSLLSTSVVSQGTAILITGTVTNTTCNGGNIGAINLSVTGGVGPYTYNWGPGLVMQNRTGLSAGTYIVTVSDNVGCTASKSFVVSQPGGITASSTTTNVACNGGNNGTIILTVAGGTSPYTYNWGGGFVTPNRNNLVAGSYTVTITDNANCSISHTAVIAQTTSLNISPVITNVSCNGQSNGAINLTITGGATPYTYNWGNAITTPGRTGLSAGSYVVTITDNSNCTLSSTMSVNQPNVLSVIPTITNAACTGGNTGAINITVNGGTAPYAFNWGGNITTQDRINIPAGNYSLTVTDNANCTASIPSIVVQAVNLTLSPVITNVTCYNGNNGTISVTAGAGTAPYSYNWGNNIVSQNRANLQAGTYNVTATDIAGCSGTGSNIITQPAAITVTPIITNASCNGGNNGTISLTPNGGTAPYSFLWTNGATTSGRTGLIQGSYPVTVSDNNMCSFNTNITVNQAAPMVVNNTKSNVACFGAATGSINLSIIGGNAPYGFLWSNAASTQNISGLVANSYNVTVTDATTCTASTSVSITQAPQITTSISTINATCFGWSSGQIDLTVSGGTGAYGYLWSNAATTQDLLGVAANTYTVTVHDANSCTVTASTTITQPAQLVLTSTKINASCFSSSTGSIDLSVSGGAAPYTYAWSNAAASQDISNLTAASYNVIVNDNNACSASTSVAITQPSALVASQTHTNVSCNGGANGTINTAVTGGTYPYSYNWGGGNTLPNRTNLSAGNFTITVNDSKGCSVTATSIISEPAPIAFAFAKTNVVCSGSSTGSIDATISGGTGAYTYHWNTNALTQDLWNLNAGNYSLTVTDANTCTSSAMVAIAQPAPLTVVLTHTDISCFGAHNGSIMANVSGGNGGYVFDWSNGATTANLNNLPPNNYVLSLSDAAGCATSIALSIIEPSALTLAEAHSNITCNGAANGNIHITATGGTGNYSYAWSNGSSTPTISSLLPNNYTITVSDAKGCTASKAISITQPAPLVVSETHQPYACSGNAGAIDITVSGGNLPYTYLWNNHAITEDISNLNGGTYSVVVSDINACSSTTAVSISVLTSLSTTVTHTDLLCNGISTGSIHTVVTGGSSPYTFNWNTGAASQDLNALAAGSYSAVITDANHCSVSAAAVLKQPAPVAINISPKPVSCFGFSDGELSIQAFGGTAPYTYNWDNASSDSTIKSIPAGSYDVTVTDANSCKTNFTTLTVTQPAQLTVSSYVVNVGCASTNDGELHFKAEGGVPPYIYESLNSHLAMDMMNLPTGDYTVTVTDNNGCQTSKVEVIGLAPPLQLTPQVKNQSCAEVKNGAVSLNITGGTPVFNYLWSNGDTLSALSSLPQGQYSVTVSDSRRCSAEASFALAVDYELQIDATKSTTINLGESLLLSVVVNTDHNNQYTWTPAENITCSTCQNTLTAPTVTTLYTVNVVDANGCKAVDTLTVEVKSVSDIFIPNAFSPNGDGQNDFLQIYGNTGTLAFVDFMVFDRWGEKVFESGNANFSWDGTYKGELVPPGAYIYTMKAVFMNGYARNDFKGSVTVLK